MNFGLRQRYALFKPFGKEIVKLLQYPILLLIIMNGIPMSLIFITAVLSGQL